MPWIALVTGANKGIGKAIVYALAFKMATDYPEKRIIVYLGSRDEERGEDAVNELNKPGKLPSNATVKLALIDVTQRSTITQFAEQLKADKQYLDVLVNNAGMAHKGDAFDAKVVRTTLKTNCSGTYVVTQTMLPVMRKGGRIIMVSSYSGRLEILSPELQREFTKPDFKRQDINILLRQFEQSVADGTYAEKGWPRQAYGVSKVVVNAMTRLFARYLAPDNILVMACHPGYIDTDMTGGKGTGTVEEGARCPTYLATSDDPVVLNGSGKFFWSDCTVKETGY
jgi:carbonyl reductase 1